MQKVIKSHLQRLLILLVFIAIGSNYSLAQTLVNAEYFFNTDPGVGNATSLSIPGNEEVDTELTISTDGLTQGMHTLFVRVQNSEGEWGIPMKKLIYINEHGDELTNIVGFEYFFNVDPGLGEGEAIVVDPANEINFLSTINTSGLPRGMHTLFVRSQNNVGQWGIPMKKLIYIDAIDSAATLVTEAEYFFNVDPGIGLATNLEFNDSTSVNVPVTINIEGLSTGIHTLYVRVKNNVGQWGIPMKKLVYIDEEDPNKVGNIVAGEYFLNTDPGFAEATAFTFDPGTEIETTFTVSGSNLPIGDQFLFVRVQDEFGRWSLYHSFAFNSVEVPFLSFIGDLDTLSVTTGNDEIPIFQDLSITASEGIDIDSALVSFKSGFIVDEDSLILSSATGFSIENEQEYIHVRGNGTVSEYLELFAELSYKNVSLVPTDTLKSIEFNVYSSGVATNKIVRYLEVNIDSMATSNEEMFNEDIPTSFSLEQNYPNPFNPSTTIQFGLPEAAIVRLEVFNVLGQRVKELVTEQLSAGFHAVPFNATDLSSGIYIYRIQAGTFVETKKMTLIK